MKKIYLSHFLIIIWLLSGGSTFTNLANDEPLTNYAKTTLKYFTSSKVNNKITGFTHSFYGPPGKFRVYKNGTWQEESWLLTRGYGLWVNINEVTLRFLCLAVGYKMGWIQTSDTYNESWGQIKTGLETLRYMQTSGNNMQFYEGHFHRTYLTTIYRDGDYDANRYASETVRDANENIQSSDDNALPFMNLLILEGLANDLSVNIPDKDSIITLCQQIRKAIDLKDFVVNNKIVFNYTNGSPSIGVWDRISAEGPIILAAIFLANQINETEFNTIKASLLKKSVNWNNQIFIEEASYHSAMFIHGLRMFHGLPVTDEEYPGLNYYDTSIKPVTMAQIHFADTNHYYALGTQVMTQTFLGIPLLNKITPSSEQVQFAGNENNIMPVYGSSLSRATGTHAWFIPLSRSNHLEPATVNKLLSYMALYQNDFFHNGSDAENELGWEAAIPWWPTDKTYSWMGTDGQTKYTDWGRPYEALNTAYIVLSIFDALNQDKPLADYSMQSGILKRIADNLENDSPISNPPPKIISFSPSTGTAGTAVIIKGYNFTNTASVTIGGIAAQSFHIDSDSQITASLGFFGATGKVVVVTPNGTITSKETFIYNPLKTIVGVWAGLGVWLKNTGTGTWVQLNPLDAVQLAAGDLDGDGLDDLVGWWNFGIWVRYNKNGSWEKVLDSEGLKWLACGDINGLGKDDIVGSWDGLGVWVRYSETGTWERLNQLTADQIACGDLDGDKKDDLVGVWDIGIWIGYANGSWEKVPDSDNVKFITAGDMNDDGKADLVGSWNGLGVWVKYSSGSWDKILDASADCLALGDIDGNGKDDLLGIWSSVPGLWVRYSETGTWEKIHDVSPTWITAGKMR